MAALFSCVTSPWPPVFAFQLQMQWAVPSHAGMSRQVPVLLSCSDSELLPRQLAMVCESVAVNGPQGDPRPTSEASGLMDNYSSLSSLLFVSGFSCFCFLAFCFWLFVCRLVCRDSDWN